MDEQKKKCDYVVMTNPHDADDTLSPNIQWPGLSLAAVQSLLGALELEELAVERERGWVKKKPKDPSKPPAPLV